MERLSRMQLDMFALDEEVTRQETVLAGTVGTARLPVLVALAWHVRQRDTRRALALADEAQQWLVEQDASLPATRSMIARLLLVCGEAKWLCAELDAAQELARAALGHFSELTDWLGSADVYWLQAVIGNDRGQTVERDAALESGANFARLANDMVRVDIMEATLAFMQALQNCHLARERWGGRFIADAPDMHPAVEARVCDFLGLLANLSSDFGKAAILFARTHEAAQKSGQIRRAIFSTLNTGDAFASLNDHHAALDWMQRGLDQARQTGWHGSVGVCLMQTAETLRRLGRLEAAHQLLQETLVIMAPLADSREYAVALSYVADLALDRGDYAEALFEFNKLEQRAVALCQIDIQIDAKRGQAHALSQLDQLDAAQVAAHAALTLARPQHDASRQMAVLTVLSGMYERHPDLPCPVSCENPVLYYLQMALDVAATIEGFTIPGELLDAIARQYARVGNFTQAYQISMQAIASREKTHGQQATNRAIAMQVRHQTERAQALREHHRQLALSEAQRVQVLHQNSMTLERLGAIGQEITAQLNTEAVLQALNRHVHGLLDASSFAIFLLDHSGHYLDMAFGIEGETVLAPARIAVSDPKASTARCVRERCELLRDHHGPAPSPNLMAGTLPNASGLFAPLTIGERILGVMTIQSQRRHAYAERERLIFRTLCAYGAIALDNASAYQQLQQTQAQLVAQEKLAALGSLVAGVAHELNTPIGNSLMMASALQQKTDDIETKLDEQSLLYSDLCTFLSDAQEASAVIMRGLTSAAELVNSFKQVAMDRTTAQRRIYNLQQTSQEIIATIMSQIRLSGHSIELDIADSLVLDGYPGPYGQVITNFINNALLHAFDGKTGGQMRLSARQESETRVQIVFEDNGVGIAETHLGQIFDPFFTTKMGQGGNGLGLYTSYNIITSLLKGKIEVSSRVGVGTRFMLNLPLVIPDGG
jgi:signal transduction histidine kinase